MVATTIPALAAESAAEQGSESLSESWSIEQAEADLMEALRGERKPSESDPTVQSKITPWKHPRLLAIVAVILATCSTAAYQIGMLQGRKPEVADVRAAVPAPKAAARLEQPALYNCQRWRRRHRRKKRNLSGCGRKLGWIRRSLPISRRSKANCKTNWRRPRRLSDRPSKTAQA